MKYLLLHGLGQTPSDWSAVMKELPSSYELECPDLMKWLKDKPVYERLYRSFAQYCDRFEEPVHICGLSLGGMLALRYALAHKERVASLVLIGTQAHSPQILLRLQDLMFRMLPASAFHSAGLDKKAMRSFCRSMRSIDLRNELKNISCPALIICGEKDRANKAASLLLREQIPQARYVTLPAAGHESNKDHPRLLAEELLKFW